MEAEGNVELLQRVPEGVVVGVVPRAARGDVGAKEDGAEAKVLDAAASLGHGLLDIEGGDHGGAEEP